ncbi:MAG: DUF3293 domain-containing protein [Lewinellaceae bacterium]|nr:DUF3293 domain-containing protein [Lewinellaceae bacterium]
MSKPVIVIRKVEDSPDWVDRELLTAYIRTEYRGENDAVLHIGCALPPMLLRRLSNNRIRTLAVLTAWNPASVLLPEKENRLRTRALKEDLSLVCTTFWRGFNVDPGGRWPAEESFWAFGIDAARAVALGRRYGQNALVWWEPGATPALWWL